MHGQAIAPPPVLRDAAAPEPVLDPADRRMLALLAEGLPLDAVARRVCTSSRTLRRRIRAVCDRLGVGTSIEAVVWAARRGLI